MYLNDVPLGQRGSFAIVGVAEAARLFFGKDVSNVTLAEAATIAGVIQSPSALSPFNNPTRCRERRNVVLQAMVDAGYVDAGGRRPRRAGAARPSCSARSKPKRRTSSTTSARRSTTSIPGLTTTTDAGGRRLHDARSAPAAAGAGRRARRADQGRPAAVAAASARAGPKRRSSPSIRGPARSSRWSAAARTTSRSTTARSSSRRQPGSVFKPFVYLAAFEQAADAGTHRHHAGVDRRRRAGRPSSSTIRSGRRRTTRTSTTARSRSGARWRSRATSRRSTSPQAAGYDRVAALWKKLGVGTAPKAYPSIALGVFEATPFEIATAYTIFPNMRRDAAAAAHRCGSSSGGEGRHRRRTPRRRARSRGRTRPSSSRT